MTIHPAASGFPLPSLTSPVRTIGARTIDFSTRIAVMAIINRTPDSFFDRGRTFALDRAVDAALTAAAGGADWVDIGGVKFAPGPRGLGRRRARPRAACRAGRGRPLRCRHLGRHVPARGGGGVHRRRRLGGERHHGVAEPGTAPRSSPTGATLVITHSLARAAHAYPAPRYDDVVQRSWTFCENASSGHGPRRRRVADHHRPGARSQQEHPALPRDHPAASTRSRASDCLPSRPCRTRTSWASRSTRHARGAATAPSQRPPPAPSSALAL